MGTRAVTCNKCDLMEDLEFSEPGSWMPSMCWKTETISVRGPACAIILRTIRGLRRLCITVSFQRTFTRHDLHLDIFSDRLIIHSDRLLFNVYLHRIDRPMPSTGPDRVTGLRTRIKDVASEQIIYSLYDHCNNISFLKAEDIKNIFEHQTIIKCFLISGS